MGKPATIHGIRLGAPFTEVVPCQREAGHPDDGHGLDLETLRRSLPEGAELFPSASQDAQEGKP